MARLSKLEDIHVNLSGDFSKLSCQVDITIILSRSDCPDVIDREPPLSGFGFPCISHVFVFRVTGLYYNIFPGPDHIRLGTSG